MIMDHDETGSKALEGPKLCVNNCGFFGSAITRDLCSKCHKEALLKEDQEMPAIVNSCCDLSSRKTPKVKNCVNRCTTCRMRVGILGFSCRCGNLFCSSHRHSDKHDCPFNYRSAARDSIATANPIIKAVKLQKI